jgi:integrase
MARAVDGVFSSPSLKSAIRLAVRATPRPRRRKSAKAVTGDVLAKMLATCSGDSLRDIRDRAILMVAFASGGRRRSEIAGLRREQLTVEPPITVEGGPPLPSLAIHLGRTKTTGADQDDIVYLTGRPVEALNAHGWRLPKSKAGACFERSIVGAMFRSGRWSRVRSMRSSSSGRRWPGWSLGSSRRTGCDPDI